MIHVISARGEEEGGGVERLVLSPEKSSISFDLTCGVKFTLFLHPKNVIARGLPHSQLPQHHQVHTLLWGRIVVQERQHQRTQWDLD